jgi:subtilase family serine protease
MQMRPKPAHPAVLAEALVRFPLVLLITVTALILVLGSNARAAPAPHAISSHKMTPNSRAGERFSQFHPTSRNNGGLFCQQSTAQFHCYLPAQMYNAYNISPLLAAGNDGRGTTIAIVDAFQDPTIASDLKNFDAQSGIADPPSFKVYQPNGMTPYDINDANQQGWSGEIALDVEWAHAIAPEAAIALVLAPTNNDTDIYKALKYAVNLKGVRAISMSFAEAEQCMDPTLMSQQSALFSSTAKKGISFTAGAGDVGSAQYFPCDGNSFVKAAATPASDPNVTGVGGTDLKADLSSGRFISEVVWDEVSQYAGAGGGGFSSDYSRPAYQNGAVSGSVRGLPDVAYSASNAWGCYVYWASSNQGFHNWTFAGTSVGTPQWGALIDLASQQAGHGMGNVNPELYSLAASNQSAYFNDISSGNNDFGKISGYRAAKGWDAASGLGSPNAAALVPALAP